MSTALGEFEQQQTRRLSKCPYKLSAGFFF